MSLIFLHIPKTAGTTFNAVLTRQYRRRHTFTFTNYLKIEEGLRQLKTLSAEKRARIKLFRGHIPFGLHREIPWECRYVTLLRHPVKRIVSFYHYLRKYRVNGRPIIPRHCSLVEWAAQPEHCNLQVRYLSGMLWKNSHSPEVHVQPVTEAELQQAQDNIARYFSGVGLLEEFDKTLLLFQDLLHWSAPFYQPLNQAEKAGETEEASALELKLIEELNALDMQLYAEQKTRFEAQWAARPRLHRKLASFHHMNQFWMFAQRWLRRTHRNILETTQPAIDAVNNLTPLHLPAISHDAFARATPVGMRAIRPNSTSSRRTNSES